MPEKQEPQLAVFAGGCFWCTEAIFQRIKGVLSVTPGYSGGKQESPSYEDVGTGNTGHAEAVQIIFDPEFITFDTLLDVFFATHDPTTINRQGNDEGAQYRSIIFYADEKQKSAAEDAFDRAQANNESLIVTLLLPLEKFYEAEENHKDYFNNHKEAGYCKAVIDPKIKKLFKDFPDITT